MQSERGVRPETQMIHAGEPSPRIAGSVAMPVFQSSTYERVEGEDYQDIGYIRFSNTPNHHALAAKLSVLEGSESALLFASGMAAVTTSLLAHLCPGGHLLIGACLYGGTHGFVFGLIEKFGLTYSVIDINSPETWESQLHESSRVIYTEVMTNPLLEVADHEAVVRFAKAHGLVSMIDNTFASPVNFRPCEFGYDLSIQSATKYLNGHSDIVAGTVAGSRAHIDPIKQQLDYLGGCMDPHQAWLLHRGMKTLAVRVRHQNANAVRLAEMLSEHPKVCAVNYPGLSSSPWHARAEVLFDGFGGMLSFEPDTSPEGAEALLKALEIPILAPSLGGVESLVTLPAKTSHAGLSKLQREEMGVSERLIRVSVGIEHIEDLIGDFERALECIDG